MDKDRRLTSSQVQERYSIAGITLYRWHKDPTSDFPKPMVFRGRKYWRVGDLENWDAAHAPKIAEVA